MSRKHNVLPMKPSVAWAREAPTGATALIVAESSTEDRRNRRVALAWLSGQRNDAAQLREAAARLDDTATLATSGKDAEHQDIDGSCCLKSDPRCHVRWTVRSIPVSILTCWTGFEDAINVPTETAPGVKDEVVVPETRPESPAPSPEPQCSKEATNLPAKPAVKREQAAQDAQPAIPKAQPAKQPRLVAISKPSTKTGASDRKSEQMLPTFAPINALILDRKKAFSGNCAVPGKFITDGRTLLVTSACDLNFVTKVKPITAGPYNSANPVPIAQAQKLFDSTVQDARYNASIHGYVLGRSIGRHEAEEPFLCLIGPGDRVTVVNGHRVLLIQSVTGANVVKVSVDPKSSRVTFFKDDQPVAVLISLVDGEVRSLFQQMLDAEKSSQNVTRIAA